MVTDDRPYRKECLRENACLSPSNSHPQEAVAAIAIATALTTFGLLEAQQGAPVAAAGVNPAGANASKYNIAVVDISYIFKKHERFKSTMEQMKKEMETIETELKGDREKIAARNSNAINSMSARPSTRRWTKTLPGRWPNSI